jgi:toxin ParE1/3/4
MARVRITGPARRDLKAIRRYIATDSPDRAQAVVDRILDRCALLGVAPAQGRVRDDGPPIAGEVRSVPVPPYVVFYRIAGNVVQVLRVVDGRRDLGTAFFSD